MTTAVTEVKRRSPGAKVIRSYAPLAIAGLAFIVMATVVKPVDRRHDRLAAAATGPLAPGLVASGGGSRRVARTGGGSAGGPGGNGSSAGGGGGSGGATGGVQPCKDRAQQVPGDPYSPPCYAFSGNNGGATSKGVTGNVIHVSARQLEGPSAARSSPRSPARA